MRFRWISLLILVCGPAHVWADHDFAAFAHDLIDLEALSNIQFAPTRMESTYDRTGGNADGFNAAWLKNGIYTIANLKGPGVVRRFYSARPGGQLRIYVHGAPKPIIDMSCAEFFAGRRPPFLQPVVGPMGGGNYSYFPIPYARSIRIQTTPLGGTGEDAYGVYYQVTYQTFRAGTPVRSLQLPLTPAGQDEWRSVLAAWKAPGADPKPLNPGQSMRLSNYSSSLAKPRKSWISPDRRSSTSFN